MQSPAVGQTRLNHQETKIKSFLSSDKLTFFICKKACYQNIYIQTQKQKLNSTKT